MRIPALPVAVLALTFALLLCHPLAIGRADESHLLHGARRVLDGDTLYRDFLEIITPLGFYFFAAVFHVFGTTLRAARVAMALVNAVGAAAMFVLARRIAGAGPAALATLLFVVVCLPVWPIASAHWISTSLTLVAAAVLLGERPATTRFRPLATGVVTGAAICVQQQRGVFLALWLGLSITVLAFAVPGAARWRGLVRDLAYAVGGAVGVIVIVLGQAAFAASLTPMVDALYRFPVETYANTMTLDIRWADAIPLTTATLPYTWHWLLRWSPAFAVVEAVILLGGARRALRYPELVRACVCLLGLLMALSVWYLRDFIHVAFVTPFLLLPGARLLAGACAAISQRIPRTRGLVTAVLLAAGVVIGRKGFVNVRRAYAVVPVALDTGFGRIRTDPDMARLYAAVARHVVREPDGRALAYSFPDDAWLYLTLPAYDATPFDILLLTFPRRYVDEVVDVLRRRVPGTVVLLRPIPAGEIASAVEAGYDRVEQAGLYDVYVRRDAVRDR